MADANGAAGARRRLDMLDGVATILRLDAFAVSARGGGHGFDGKTLIHPADRRSEPRLRAVAGSTDRGATDKGRLFTCENAGKGVISLHGKMVERLHWHRPKKLLAKAAPSAHDPG